MRYRETISRVWDMSRFGEIIQVPRHDEDIKSAYLRRRLRKRYNAVTKVFWARVMPEEISSCHQKWISDEIDDLLRAIYTTAGGFVRWSTTCLARQYEILKAYILIRTPSMSPKTREAARPGRDSGGESVVMTRELLMGSPT